MDRLRERPGRRRRDLQGARHGKRLRQLTKNNVRNEDPSWSSKGLIAWESGEGNIQDIWVMRANGKRKRNLTKSPLADDGDPNFSPNGKLIAWDREPADDANEDIWVMKVNGKGKRQLTTHSAGDEDPVFSPNGKLIAFVSDRRADQDDLYVMRANGKRQRLLYGSTGAIEQGPNWGRKPAKKRKRR